MKKWGIFCLLKVGEIFGVCIFFVWCSWFGGFFEPEYSIWMRMIPGLAVTLAIIGVCLLMYLWFPVFIKKNIEWAEKLSNR